VRSKVSTNEPMHSSELARLAGVSTDTLRYCERLGLLPAAPRSASGYRLFPAQALHRVPLIRGALATGFSIRELTEIFAERDRGRAPCQRVFMDQNRRVPATEQSQVSVGGFPNRRLRTILTDERRSRKMWIATEFVDLSNPQSNPQHTMSCTTSA